MVLIHLLFKQPCVPLISECDKLNIFAILALMSGNMQSHILQGFVAHTTQDLR